nr:hypothetical protein Iba_chr11bCG15020 [Ipomoea batatas]
MIWEKEHLIKSESDELNVIKAVCGFDFSSFIRSDSFDSAGPRALANREIYD